MTRRLDLRPFTSLFRFDNRAGPRELGGVALGVVLACGAAVALDQVVVAPGHHPFTIFVGLTSMVVLVAAAWRRLHDRGRRGAWILPVLVGPGVFAGASIHAWWLAATRQADISEVTREAIGPQHSVFIGLTLLISFVMGLWVLVELMRAGEPGINRFGPPPGYAHTPDRPRRDDPE